MKIKGNSKYSGEFVTSVHVERERTHVRYYVVKCEITTHSHRNLRKITVKYNLTNSIRNCDGISADNKTIGPLPVCALIPVPHIYTILLRFQLLFL